MLPLYVAPRARLADQFEPSMRALMDPAASVGTSSSSSPTPVESPPHATAPSRRVQASARLVRACKRLSCSSHEAGVAGNAFSITIGCMGTIL
jgi:hypothetical protein